MRSLSSRQAKAKAISKETKDRVWCRDAGRCVYCRQRGLPEAHYISRAKGGLGIPENILTLCRSCHDKYDNGKREQREGMREYFREYLQSHYPEWDETKLIYHKEDL